MLLTTKSKISKKGNVSLALLSIEIIDVNFLM